MAKIVLRLALARPLEDQRRHAARQERRLVGVAFLLGGIQTHRHHHHRRPVVAQGLAQNAGEHLAFVRDAQALARRTQEGQRRLPAFDRLHVRHLHLRHVVDEQKGREVVVDAGALQAFAGGELMPALERLAAELFVMRRARRPGGAPLVVALERPVTSSKSVSTTPLATKRGPQWAIAASSRGSIGNRDFHVGQSAFSSRRYQGMKRRVADFTSNSKPTPKAASSSTPTKASLW